ncbi:bifunctional alpha/beta hydrolase/OsmC family protein [Sediminitomix flava]|uniref:Putative redox protein n=1 Tax=Sediminitomix flava TaxID=379075 RepID=A0A315ZHI3_SEDFL|nr:bifunctional alpha/beta hydrolase/OsmC family protein [Sediminitomix flava]PWJ44981.1 putative redox protein [Sediminitomix flava]
MNAKKIHFTGKSGQKIAARLELPPNQDAQEFVLFAHCFTCNKDLSAVRNISRQLASSGFGVLRFDFTGLGESEGEFADTNFSNNLDDLISAADFLKQNFKAPSLLVGHSLGGAAVLYIADKIPSVSAVATIGAPSQPVHVKHLFANEEENIILKGSAEVNIGGRPFTIQKQFIEDLENRDLETVLKSLRKAILILHSPQDQTVSINNAAEIYNIAFHPKSFISLDGADHLLSKVADSLYVGEVISSWAKRYIPFPEDKKLDNPLHGVAHIGTEKYATQIKVGKHYILADEPESVGGKDYGPTPYDFVMAGLGSCTAITLKMYADHKKLDVEDIYVHLEHDKIHADDSSNTENSSNGKIDQFRRVIEVKGNLTDEQKERLLQIANKCPVHKTLEQPVKVITELKS